MQRVGVDVFFGTVERANEKLVDTALLDPKASNHIKGAGFQWAGKRADGIVEPGSVNFVAVRGRPSQTFSFADVTDEFFVPFRAETQNCIYGLAPIDL